MNTIDVIKTTIKPTFITLIIILTQACGYRITEDDKYPNMQIYPQTSNTNYVIDSLFETDNQIKYSEQYMYCVSNEITKNNSASVILNILDKNLNIVKKILVSSSLSYPLRYNIDSNNNIYFIGDDEKLYKYNYPWDQAVEIPKILDVSKTDEIKQKYAETIRKKLDADSSFYVEGFIDSIFKSKIKKLYEMNPCVLLINESDPYKYVILNDSLGQQSYIVTRDDKQLWEMFYPKEKPDCDSLLRNNTYYNSIESPNLTLEQVAFGNRSAGNHFVFWYIPYGYDYYTITINNDTIKFKIENKNLNYPTFRQTGSRFTDKILLLTHNNILCKVRKK